MKRLLIICVAAVFMTVQGNTVQAVTWYVPEDFATIQLAIDDASVADGDKIVVQAGIYFGATVNKAVEIVGEDAVINDGPNTHSFLRGGFVFPGGGTGSGATIRGFTFLCESQPGYTDDGKLDFPVFSRGANEVTVEHNLMVNSLQAITNWSGSGWEIAHNEIHDLQTLNGGGIGILVGDYQGGTVEDNMISHNTITGTLNVWENDGGGYAGSGIVLYADFRSGKAGAYEIKNNIVIKNKVSLVSDTPDVVDVVAFELTDTRDNETLDSVIFDNSIGFNDFRGTVLQIALTPEKLDECNDISRNLGENRGQGLHPSVFGAGID